MGQPSGSVDQSAAITVRRRNDPEAMEGVEGAGVADGLRTTDHMTVHDIESIHTLIEDVRTDGNNVVAIERSHLIVRTTLAGGSKLEEAADLKYLKSKMAELRKTFECHGMGEVINIQAGSLLIMLRINGLDEVHSLQTGTYLDVGKKKLQGVLSKGREDRDASNADIGGLTLQSDEQDLEQARHFFLTDQITVPVKFLFCHERRCWYWTLDMEILHGLDVFSVQAGTHVGRRLVVRLVELVRKLQCASTAPADVEPRHCLICESRADFKYDKERRFGDKEAAVTSNSPIQETDVPRPVGSAEHREAGDPDAGAAAADPAISVEETEPPGDFEPAGQQLSPEQVNEWINDVRPRQIADGRIGHGMQSNVRFNAADLSSNAQYDVDNYPRQPLSDWLGIVDLHRLSEGSLLLPIVLLSREELKTIQCQDVQQMLLKRMRKLLIEQRKAGGVSVGALESLTIEISPEDIDKLEHFYAADPIPLPASYVFCGETCYWYWTADGNIFHRVDVCQVAAGKYKGQRLREHEIQLCWKLWQLTEGPLKDHNRCPVCKHRKSNDGHIFPKEAAKKPETHGSSTSTTAKPGHMMEPTVMEELESMMTDLRHNMERAGIAVLERRDIAEERVIAKGGYGRVIIGTLKSDGSRVIKRMLASKYNVDQAKLSAKESKLLSTIKHPNIVSLLAMCIEPTSFSPVMEFMEFNLEQLNIHGQCKGSTLAELLDVLERANLVEEIGVRRLMFYQAAHDVVTGLAFLHHKDICHRDMKPANILVTNTGHLFTFKLTDFGEGRATNLQTESVSHENTDRVQRETRRFFSPEQIMDSLKVADISALKRIDVWSCGMVIFCLLSPDITLPWDMDLPSQGNQDEALKARIAARQLPRGSKRYKHLADETGLGVIYHRCCHFDPASRPDIDVIQSELHNLTFNLWKPGRLRSPRRMPGSSTRAGDVPEKPREPPIDAERTPEAADNPRAMEVRAKAKQLPKAVDQTWDAAAYRGLRVTGVVGEEAGPGRLQDPRGVATHGDLVWVADSHRVVVFRRTTEGGHTAHRYVAEYPVQYPGGIAATDTEIWISQYNGQLQGVRVEGGEVVLTRTLPATGRLTEPYGLAYRESTRTLYVCCKDGLHVVDVAGGGVVATLNTPPEVKEGRRPRYVSVLQDTILVRYGLSRLVLYTGDGAPGRVLNLPGPPTPGGVTHNGEHFVVCDSLGGSLLVVSREGEAVTRVRLEGEVVTRVGLRKVRPWRISWSPHHHLLYVTDINHKLFVVSR